MADGNSSVLLQQQYAHRLANNITAADNYNVLAFQLNAIVRQSCHAGTRSAGSKTAAAHEHITDILRIQAVYVLVRRNRCAHVIAVDMLRHRHHRHNTGNVTVTVQLFDDADNLFLRSIGRAGDNLSGTAQTFNQFDQPVLIYVRCGIITHNQNSQSY